jgi:hypothetical protein
MHLATLLPAVCVQDHPTLDDDMRVRVRQVQTGRVELVVAVVNSMTSHVHESRFTGMQSCCCPHVQLHSLALQ